MRTSIRRIGATIGLLLSMCPAVSFAQILVSPGETVVVLKDGVQLGMRDQPLISLSAGTQMRVTEIRGKWIGGYVMLERDKRLGWVHQSEVRVSGSIPSGPGLPDIADDPRSIAAWQALGVSLQLDGQGRIQQLAPSGAQVQVADLVQLAGLHHLSSLDLSSQPVTDEGMKHIAACPSLQKLYLDGTKITDAGLVHLAKLTRVEVLVLANTSVTGAGLEHLKGMVSLQVLNLGHCDVQDDHLRSLAPFTQLEVLTLPHTKVSDAGLEFLRPLEKLRVINLDGTPVMGSGFEHLLGLSELRMLYVRDCMLEPGKVDKLNDKLPGLAIYD